VAGIVEEPVGCSLNRAHLFDQVADAAALAAGTLAETVEAHYGHLTAELPAP
jgi:hypothetical protein